MEDKVDEALLEGLNLPVELKGQLLGQSVKEIAQWTDEEFTEFFGDHVIKKINFRRRVRKLVPQTSQDEKEARPLFENMRNAFKQYCNGSPIVNTDTISDMVYKLPNLFEKTEKYVRTNSGMSMVFVQRLYTEYKSLPTTSIMQCLRKDYNLHINGYWGSGDRGLYYGNFIHTGLDVIVKVAVGSHQDEVEICETITKHQLYTEATKESQCCLVSMQIVDTSAENRKGVFRAVVMKRYVDDLAHSHRVLLPSLFFRQARRIVDAVNMLHSIGYVHCDIRLDQIFIDEQGNWHLGDFGSCLALGTGFSKVRSSSCYHPKQMKTSYFGEESKVEYNLDWHMLAVALALFLRPDPKVNSAQQLVSKENACTPAENVIKFLEIAVSQMAEDDQKQIMAFFQAMLKCNESQFNFPTKNM